MDWVLVISLMHALLFYMRFSQCIAPLLVTVMFMFITLACLPLYCNCAIVSNYAVDVTFANMLMLAMLVRRVESSVRSAIDRALPVYSLVAPLQSNLKIEICH